MLKKVTITNVHTGAAFQAVVDTDTNEKALIGAGVSSSENAAIEDITGVDETIHRFTSPKDSPDDRVLFFNGLATCLERNIGMIKSLQLQANRVKTPKYRGVIAEMAYDLSIGEKFSDAAAKHSVVFPPEILSLLIAGEEAGQLAAVCKRLGSSQKKTARILKKLKTGMIYPAIVMVLGVGVVIAMSYTLVPAMKNLYTQLHVALPFGTRALLVISNTLIHQPWTVLLPIMGIVMLFKNFGKIAATKTAQNLFLKMPVVGGLVRKSASAVSFRCLAMLIEANVRLSSALKITADSSWHWHYKTFFEKVGEHVTVGGTLFEGFVQEAHWLGKDSRNLCGLMELSAETGTGTEMLNEIASDYEDELDSIASQIDKILEPITIVCLGCIVGFLVYAIYAPIFSIGDALLPKSGKH